MKARAKTPRNAQVEEKKTGFSIPAFKFGTAKPAEPAAPEPMGLFGGLRKGGTQPVKAGTRKGTQPIQAGSKKVTPPARTTVTAPRPKAVPKPAQPPKKVAPAPKAPAAPKPVEGATRGNRSINAALRAQAAAGKRGTQAVIPVKGRAAPAAPAEAAPKKAGRTLSLPSFPAAPRGGTQAASAKAGSQKVAAPARKAAPRAAPAPSPTAAASAAAKESKTSTSYTLLGSPFPLRPVFERKTLVTTVVPNKMWSFEQQQGLGFSNVTINTRMTVIRLASGGLWVHAPIAPTRECIDAVKELGEVEHIVLPTFAIEHKVFFGPFARQFPDAALWVAPEQWSFPVNLPLSFLGLGFRGATELSNDLSAEACPWREEIDLNVNLNSSFSDIGPYCEVAFFHRDTRTLLVTDCVVQVPRQPVEVVAQEPELLLTAAVPNPFNPFAKPPEDSPAARELGWRRMCTQVLFFGPDDLTNPSPTFEKLCEPQVICSPVVRTLVFSKCPEDTLRWAEKTAEWDFAQVIPCHFTGPFPCTPAKFLQSFQFCYDAAGREAPKEEVGFIQGLLPFGKPEALGPAVDFDRDTPKDMKILNGLNDLLIKAGAVDK